jgi:hypothetical protein
MKGPYDIDTVYDDRGLALGFIWRKHGGGRWGALLSPRCIRCSQHCAQERLGAFPDRAAALAAVVANLKPDARGRPQ